MLTIETTDHVIKIFENCASRAIEPNTVLRAGASNDDTAELLAVKTELAELRALQATVTPAPTNGAARTGKRARVHRSNAPKVVLTCPVYNKNGHDAQGCYQTADNMLAEAAKLKNDAEEILKSKSGHKKDLKAFMTGFPANDPGMDGV